LSFKLLLKVTLKKLLHVNLPHPVGAVHSIFSSIEWKFLKMLNKTQIAPQSIIVT